MADEQIDIDNPPAMIDRGLALNRYTGETVYAPVAVGFGDGEFGEGVFGWT